MSRVAAQVDVGRIEHGDELPAGVGDLAWLVVVYGRAGSRHYHRVFAHSQTGARHAEAALARGAGRVVVVPCRLVPLKDVDR